MLVGRIIVGSFLMLTLLLAGCHCDGPEYAPISCSVRFEGPSPRGELTRLWAEGATSDQHFENERLLYNNNYEIPNATMVLNLPVSLVNDLTTYYFQYGDHTDSLTVRYKRNFRYTEYCGFVAQVEAIPNGVTSTFSQVTQPQVAYGWPALSVVIKP